MSLSRRLAAGAIGFFVLEALLIGFVDRPLSEALRNVDAQHHAWIDFFRATTDFAKAAWYLWPSAAGILVCAVLVRFKSVSERARACAARIGNRLLFLFICGALSGIVTDIIKPILGRARPVELEQSGLYGFHPLTFAARWNSMPSGHATSAFTFVFVLAGFFPRWRVPLFCVAAFFALSRIMVNAHFLSDVLAGAAVAFLTVAALQAPKGKNGIFHIGRCIFPIDEKPAMR